MKIAIDVFGGDNSPGAVLDGCGSALKKYSDIELILVGDEGIINEAITGRSEFSGRTEILHAPDVISCDEQPTQAIKRKKESSLVRALECVANKSADAFISAGSSGAVLAGATLIVRRISGIKRPALAPVIPTEKTPVLLIDCGANADAKPEYLQQFAMMGSAYMHGVLGVENPRVGLINNGAEAEKGNMLTKEAYSLLTNAPVNFVGNCEARDILSGSYDVLVCDGFVGNVVLKYTEGLASSLMHMIKAELTSGFTSKIGAMLCKKSFKRFKKRMDYTEYGGAPLLGINGCIIKAHGSSDAKAFESAIMQARNYIIGNVTESIAAAVKTMGEGEQRREE